MAVALGPVKTCIACGLKFYVSREHIFREFGFTLHSWEQIFAGFVYGT